MSLSLDELRAVVAILHASLLDARVRQVRAVQDRPASLVLELRTPGSNHHLLVCAESGASRIHRITELPRQPERPSAFVMSLRKHVVGGRVRAVRVAGGDRIVAVEVAHDDPDRPQDWTLMCELTGRHANVALLASDGRIAALLLRNKSGRRELAPGAVWSAPASNAPPGGGLRAGWPADPVRAEAFVERHYRALADEEAELRRHTEVARRIDDALRRRRRALDAVRRDIERIDGADALRRRAELLRGAHGTVERGAATATVRDWFEEGAPWATVPLDPALDLEGNIRSLFRTYKRLKRGEDAALERELALSAGVEQLERLRMRLDGLDRADAAAIAELEREFERSGPARRSAGRGGTRPAERRPYHEFRSTDGTPILVGRGRKDNDTLTFRVARGNDIWMHASDWPGSHVVVRTARGAAPSQRTMLEAAMLAAHHCKGREDTVVAVTWTERKHVRKPPGAAPGLVSVAGGRTIEVRLDPEALAPLLASRS